MCICICIARVLVHVHVRVRGLVNGRFRNLSLRRLAQLGRHEIDEAINQHRFAVAGRLVNFAHESFEKHHADFGSICRIWRRQIRIAQHQQLRDPLDELCRQRHFRLTRFR